ncbi:hypothetical protein SEA_ZOOMAN_241 [Microbacterium phage Zooman]|nr:hypothetical protein SEA_ZOOMAN_241 [Microbacterium phage Zooman]
MNLNLHSRQEFIDAAVARTAARIGDEELARKIVLDVLDVLNWDYDQEEKTQKVARDVIAKTAILIKYREAARDLMYTAQSAITDDLISDDVLDTVQSFIDKRRKKDKK